MIKQKRWRGLYAITDSALIPEGQLVSQVARAITGGAVMIQYRDKTGLTTRRRSEITALLELCRGHGIPLIINDDVALAAQIGAAGVHLGQHDMSVAQARSLLGPKAIIGVSCYNVYARAGTAAAEGADYIAFGRLFPSQTKPGAMQADPELLRRARRELGLPVVAIGGITPENGGDLIAAGADLLAAVHGIFGQSDITAAARRYASLFDEITNDRLRATS